MFCKTIFYLYLSVLNFGVLQTYKSVEMIRDELVAVFEVFKKLNILKKFHMPVHEVLCGEPLQLNFEHRDRPNLI